MDPNFAKFIRFWAESGGKESSCAELLPLAERAGWALGNAKSERGRQTVLGHRLNAAKDRRLLIDGQALTIHYGAYRRTQLYLLIKESERVRYTTDSSNQGAIEARFSRIERRLAAVESVILGATTQAETGLP